MGRDWTLKFSRCRYESNNDGARLSHGGGKIERLNCGFCRALTRNRLAFAEMASKGNRRRSVGPHCIGGCWHQRQCQYDNLRRLPVDRGRLPKLDELPVLLVAEAIGHTGQVGADGQWDPNACARSTKRGGSMLGFSRRSNSRRTGA